MRDAPIHDVFTDNGTIRPDGRVLYDRYLMRVKAPAELEISVGLSVGRGQDSGGGGFSAARGRAGARWQFIDAAPPEAIRTGNELREGRECPAPMSCGGVRSDTSPGAN